jgi:hypothetical protein
MDGMGVLLLNNGLNGAKRLNGWNDWNVCSLRAGYICQHRKKHQSQVQTSEIFASMLALLDSRARMHHYGALLMHKN